MYAVVIVPQIEVRLDLDDVWRALAVPQGATRNVRTARRIAELLPMALSLLEPRGAWAIIDGSLAATTGLPAPPDEVGIGLCTVGGALESEGSLRAERGFLLDGVVLDAVGSAAAEAAADALNWTICREARSRGLCSVQRESPGYGEWDLGRQRSLLALLPASDVGITLTEQGMMVPRKSVSFAVRLLAGAGTEEIDRCERCGMTRCRHRRGRRARHADGARLREET